MVWVREVVLGTSLAEFNPEKVPLFVAKLFRGRYDSINLNEFVNLKSGYSIFLERLDIVVL